MLKHFNRIGPKTWFHKEIFCVNLRYDKIQALFYRVTACFQAWRKSPLKISIGSGGHKLTEMLQHRIKTEGLPIFCDWKRSFNYSSEDFVSIGRSRSRLSQLSMNEKMLFLTEWCLWFFIAVLVECVSVNTAVPGLIPSMDWFLKIKFSLILDLA